MKLFVSGFVFNVYNYFNHCQRYFVVLLITGIVLNLLSCLLKTLDQFHNNGTDSMMRWKIVQLYVTKAFLAEVSEQQSSF